MNLYFAFGSNLDSDQMSRRVPGCFPVRSAFLDDAEICFRGMSRTWGGGVASFRRAKGETLPGVLYANVDFDTLDRYEGCPTYYKRCELTVRLDDGRKVMATTYYKPARYPITAPSDDYLGTIADAYGAWGFETDKLDEWAPEDDHLVFVYGTLRGGRGNYQRLLTTSECLGEHGVDGWDMYDLGHFPAIVKGSGSVTGDVFRVTPATFARLDMLEGYPRFYDREFIETPVGNAWVYYHNETPRHAEPVPSGDWIASLEEYDHA
jgi:gamma-glutamylcyclotransferase (GGCT)/AIG2-like uncharacterized protein YtfP